MVVNKWSLDAAGMEGVTGSHRATAWAARGREYPGRPKEQPYDSPFVLTVPSGRHDPQHPSDLTHDHTDHVSSLTSDEYHD